ncbi:alpha/beta hydrolase family protein [Paenibacillus eucommiae]|uniref:Dienelactone hydrolase n=1 Tax=Paenibacillus eucommiae TaxID=1355755 RepID=A0ABS4IV79_9BACL|nr:alpha/beta hydrolase family protein [Paenibacillus eucommiae]MBP1991000.1 dienelactone hydrolase [Paenibacillus eucommiae]
MWNPDAYLENLYGSVSPKYHFKAQSKAEWQLWQNGLRQELVARLGGFPEVPAALNPAILEETECEGYIRQRVAFTTYAGLIMPAYVLIPEERAVKQGKEEKQAKLPAVVACHGHGYGSREIVGLEQDGSVQKGDPGYQKNFAVELVKRGFLVIAPELLGFGDRRMQAEFETNAHSCHTLSTYLLQMGQTMAGHRVYETIRALDYLQQREDVDPRRIGCMGISGGGLVASFVAAIDDRVSAAVVSGYVSTFKESILSIHHCVDNYVPGLNLQAEMPDIVSLIAPRALLIEAGTKDPIFPVTSAIAAADQIAETYRLLGAEEKVDRDIFEGDHEISGAKAYDLLVRWLA